MQALVFATNNANKVKEVRSVLGNRFDILTLREAGIEINIPEPHDTLEENALEKARTIQQLTGSDCFSEDTGLEVLALNNAPGVLSARYAGEPASDEANIEKLLAALAGEKDRKARFRTVICLLITNETHFFEGICKGTIGLEPMGAHGFGYDPVFIPEGETRTFAEMSMEEKNKFSHRKKAMEKLIQFLEKSIPA